MRSLKRKKVYKKAWKSIIGANSILLVSHVRPDGDTLGSVLALYGVLRELKKRVHVYNCSKNLPQHLKFLPNFNRISDKVRDFDVAVVCDCGSLDRTNLHIPKDKIINIDHHKTNENFGFINVVKPKMPSATLVVYKMLRKNGINISKDVATSLYVGFLEDTGFFSYGNLTHKSFGIASKLVKKGIDLKAIHNSLKLNLPLSVLRLRAHVYSSFNLHKNGTIASVIVTKDDLDSSGCSLEDTKNMVNLLRELATVRLAIFVIQMSLSEYKISLRGKGDMDVSLIAQKFGGGGHHDAAGFEVENLLPEKIVENIIRIEK